MYAANIPRTPNASLWEGRQLKNHLQSLQHHVQLLKSLTNELDAIATKKQGQNATEGAGVFQIADTGSSAPSDVALEISGKLPFKDVAELIESKCINLNTHGSMAVEAGIAVQTAIRNMLVPVDSLINRTCPWEEISVAVGLADKRLKIKRNRKRRKKRRKLASEAVQKARERYEQADQEADEWRAREIAKDIARRKVEKMKQIAKIKAKEEQKRLESELELVLIVERLQELREIRIQKLKKQGHFLPEEDNKFVERVRAAVEEEERQAAAAADTSAATNAIATAEESRKYLTTNASGSCVQEAHTINKKQKANVDSIEKAHVSKVSLDTAHVHDRKPESDGNESLLCDIIDGLPLEFYHYYHGSNADLGTLIEVRRNWDAFLVPGGSRIPGHWVQPPQPANEIWASYLVHR